MASSCPICFEDFTQNTVRASPDACEHIFCLPCLEKWSKLGSYCPVDRKRYTKIWNLDSEAVIQVKPRKRKKRTRVLYDFSAKCELCSKDERADLLLLCDCCDLGFHTTCLSPPLKEVPAGLWFCPPCIAVEAKLKEKNGITKEVEAELSSFDPKKLKKKDLKSIQAKELENFKAKCNKNNSFTEACLNVAVEFENAEVEANNCQNDDRRFVFEDNESELDKITKTFHFETNKSTKTPFPKNTKSYSHPLGNKKTKNKPLRLSRRNRGCQENSAYSKVDDLCLNTADNNTADGDLLDPLPKDVFYGDMKRDAFSETKECKFPPILKNEKLRTTMLPSNSESEPQMNLFESFIQDPSDELNSQEIVEHESTKLFSENQRFFEEAVSTEEMPHLTPISCHEESAIECGIEGTGNSHPASEDILSGPKASTPQPSSNNTNNFIASSLEGIFSKKKNKKKVSKKKNKKKRSKEKKKSKRTREMSRRRISKEKKNENVSKYETEKRTSKLKAFFLMKYLNRYHDSSNSDTDSSNGNYEADISTSDSSSSLFFKKGNKQQYILQKFDKSNDIVNADEKNSMFKNVSSKGLNDVDQEKCMYQPSQSVNTFNLHLHCGNEESNLNGTHQKSCTCSRCAPQNTNTNTNTVNLHLHCESQTFIKIIPEKNCESAKTDDFNTSCSPDTLCVDSSGLKSKRTSPLKIEKFSENHEEDNKNLFIHYKDLKYLTVLKDGSFCINRPQSNVCKIETKSETSECEKQKFKDSMHIKSEDDLSSVAKPYLDGKDVVKFKASTSLSPASFCSSHYSTLYNQSVSSDMIKKEEPFSEFADSKCSNSEESFSRKDLKHLAIKDGLFVLQVPECKSSQSSSESSNFKINKPSLESSNNSKLSTPYCEKKSYCKSDLKHLKINKDGSFSLDLSGSQSKPSKPRTFTRSFSHCDNKSSLDLSDYQTKLSCQSTDISTSLTSHCENQSISKADLKHLKIKDGSFFLDLSDPQTKLSCKSTDTSTSLTSHCENKSISKSDLKHLKIGKDGSFILDVP